MSALTTILIIIVVVVLFTYLYHTYKDYKKQKARHNRWPPVGTPNPCPDYWINEGNGVCTNPFGLGLSASGGRGAIKQMRISSLRGCGASKPNDPHCLAAKCNWASKTNNPWFGVGKGCSKGGKCYCPY